MEKVGIFFDHLEYITAIWYILWPFGNLVAIWYIFPRSGILSLEKSGNLVSDYIEYLKGAKTSLLRVQGSIQRICTTAFAHCYF
jgi:hypothetical protein